MFQDTYSPLKMRVNIRAFKFFIDLVTLYNISIDEYLLPDKQVNKSSRRRQLDATLDAFSDNDLIVVEGTVQGICKAKEQTEE